MAYTLVIFDLDGTLADSFPWFARVLNSIADEFKFRRVADSEIDEMRRCSPRELLARLDIPLWKVPAIARYMRKLKAQHMQDIPLFPNAREMLFALADKKRTLALVSSDSEANVRRQLGEQTSALITHFDCGASLFGKAVKFKRVMKRSGMGAMETISIGDEIRDIEAARSAGIACGAVTWGYADPSTLRIHKPDLVFETFSEIAERL
jgi:phosphoglycolate phosphatase